MNKKGCCLALWLVVVSPLAIVAGTLARAADVGPGYYIDMSHMIRVRDGVELEAWITKPSSLKVKAPAILTLTQYIAPLNSPNYQQNFNTGGRMGYEKIDDARISNIRVFHDTKRPSRLMLPLAAERDPSP